MKPLTAIIAVSLIAVVVAGIVFRFIDGDGSSPAPPEPVTVQQDPLEITVLAALSVEPWLASAADVYNAEERFVGDRPVKVVIEPMDGLSARVKWARGAFTSFPTAWVAESRDWVDQANIAALDRTGQDIFLAGGRYRAQPVALSPLVWGIWPDAFIALESHSGTDQLSWDEFHDAVVTGDWEDLGGSKDWGKFKLVVARPDRDPAGLTAMVGAAGEYFDKPALTSKDLQDPEFLAWLGQLFDTVVDFSHFGAENMILYGQGNGDAGHMVENFLLTNMDAMVLRWGKPVNIVYPDPIAWFDFPFAIYMGKETSAEEKQAALEFKEFLLSASQQAEALEFGLRPACPECPSNGGLIEKWQEVGVSASIRSSRMRPPSRSGLDSLASWFTCTYEGLSANCVNPVPATLSATRTPTPTTAPSPAATPQPSPAPSRGLDLATMIEEIRPGVVRIQTDQGSGTGFIFETLASDDSALVLTNHHVVEGATRIRVIANDSSPFSGSVLAVDPARDLAVVKICCDRSLRELPFGDAAGLKVGTEVVVVGYPLGLAGSATVTRGIVSAVRYDNDTERWVIQTDAPINPGNSGGPLFSPAGEVVGMNTFKVESTDGGRPVEGLGFAVSALTLQEQLPALMK